MSTALLSRAVISERPEVLNEIANEDCNLAIWERDVPVEAKGLFDHETENLRISVPSRDPGPALRSALKECKFKDGKNRRSLVNDILTLCGIFRDLTASPSIEIRLEIVSGNSCWKFHSDYVEMRLISAYLGRGTQWINIRDAERVANGLEPEAINELGSGDVGLFKGRIGTNQPAIHRSPPINGSGEKRLLLVLNPVAN